MRTVWLPFFLVLGHLSAAVPVVLNSDGAWCWFQDERTLAYGNKVAVGSVSSQGNVQATTWDLGAKSIDIFTLRSKFEVDDHNAPGMLLRNDGRLMVFYTWHRLTNGRPEMFVRETARPGDASEWTPERHFDAGSPHGFSYANPFQLSGEKGRIYLFWRSIDFNPTWSASDDLGRTWRKAANHIYSQIGERPYVKYASNGVDTIHFAFTDGHPNRLYKNSLWHAYYRNGGLYRSDGTFLHKLADSPVRLYEATRIYDGVTTPTGEAWVWDLRLDKAGGPVVAYSTFPRPADHRYRYARWDGKKWVDREIAYAGGYLYEAESYYSGGICIDPDDVNVVYLSSNVDIQTGKSNRSGHWEIYRGVTRDGGANWKWSPLTQDSVIDNLRPIVPARHPRGTFVLWFRGTYRSYTNFRTQVVGYFVATAPVSAR